MGRRDEVVSQWVIHVLVNPCMFRVKDTVLLGQHVHSEAIRGHELVPQGCTGQKAQTQVEHKTGCKCHTAVYTIQQTKTVKGSLIC